MTAATTALLIARLAAGACAGALLVAGYRSVARQSRVIGAILAAALLLRAGVGLGMFIVSWFGLPVARSLQSGGGFWNVALDATGYYQIAAAAVNAHTLLPLTHSVPAPLYIDVLTIWMAIVGISPAAGMFLNLCLFTVLIVMLVRGYGPVDDWRRDLPCIVAVAAFSFAPVILFHSTQPLKDELTILFSALASVAMLGLRRLLEGLRDRRQVSWAAAAAVALSIAIFGMSGIRWYFGALILGSAAMTLAVSAVLARRTPLLRYAAASVVVVMLGLAAFHGSSGPYYQAIVGANLERLLYLNEGALEPATLWQRLIAIPKDMITWVQLARTGFLMSGGGSNVVVPLNDDAAAGLRHQFELVADQHRSAGYRERELESADAALRAAMQSHLHDEQELVSVESLRAALIANGTAARGIPVTAWQQFRTVVAGLAIIVLPARALGVLMGVQITGGRGLLTFADLDTIFLDVTTIAILVLVWSRRRTVPGGGMMLIFGLILSAVTALLLGYVVTNFGTLWRMRPMVVTPLWMLPLLLSPSLDAATTRMTAARDVAAPSR